MARYGIERRLRRLEFGGHEQALCADMLAAWAKQQEAAGDPGGLIAQARAEAAAWEERMFGEWANLQNQRN